MHISCHASADALPQLIPLSPYAIVRLAAYSASASVVELALAASLRSLGPRVVVSWLPYLALYPDTPILLLTLPVLQSLVLGQALAHTQQDASQVTGPPLGHQQQQL